MNECQNEMYLVHHGILGQKWGIRRYQNEDGSLTSAGRKRYGSQENYDKVQEAKTQAAEAKRMAKANKRTEAEIAKYQKKTKPEEETSEKPKTKKISEMSNQEIQERIDRIQLENRLKALQPAQISKGQEFANGVKSVVVPALKQASQEQLKNFLSKQIGKTLGVSSKEVAKDIDKTLDKYEQAAKDSKYYNDLKSIEQNKKLLKQYKEEKKKSKKKEEPETDVKTGSSEKNPDPIPTTTTAKPSSSKKSGKKKAKTTSTTTPFSPEKSAVYDKLGSTPVSSIGDNRYDSSASSFIDSYRGVRYR